MRKDRFPRRSPRSGFTLVELAIVVTLMALMAAISVPSFARLIDTTRLSKAASALAADIRRAQERAQREGKPVRVLFDTTGNTYQLQLANAANTNANCTDTHYTTFQTVTLQDTFKVVYGPQMTWPCLVFASTGRTAWANPAVLTDVANTTQAIGAPLTWYRIFNGAYSTGLAANGDPEVVYWLSTSPTPVQVTIDLGLPRYLGSACPDLIQDLNFAKAPLPTSIKLQWSNDGTAWSPASPPAFTGPYTLTKIGSTSIYWACPSLSIGQTVQYLRFTFAPAKNVNNKYMLALDEIKLPDPFVTLKNQSGRGSKTLTITPVTGKVSIQ